MKKLLILALILAFFALAGGTALAEDITETDIRQEQYDALEMDGIYDAVPEEAEDLLGDIDILAVDFSDGISNVLSKAGGQLGSILKRAAASGALLILTAIFCSLAGSVQNSIDGTPDYITLAGVLVVSVITVGSGGTFLQLGSETLHQVKTFSDILLPILTTLATASGAMTSAAAKYMATLLFLEVLITVADRVFMPLIYAYIAVSIGNAAFGGNALSGAANLLKWIANAILTVIMLCFVAYISISGIVAQAADASVTRLAKTTISTVIPVVGGIISDAASSIVAGAGLVRNAAGIFGLLAVIAICLIPFLRLGASYLMYKLASGLTGAIADSRITKLIGDMGTAFGMVMGLVGASALMVFFGIISIIKVVAGT